VPGAIDSPWLVADTLVVQGALAVALTPSGRADTAYEGDTATRPDSASVLLSGWGADTTRWTASHGAAAWLAFTTAGGTGSGTVRWTRTTTSLAAGTYVDTIRVTTSQGGLAQLVDRVEILPIPLVLETASRRDTAESGSVTAVPDSVAVTLRGPGSATATWTATHGAGAWLTLTTAAGTGSGVARWTRNPTGLVPGAYVDTIRVATSLADTAVVIDTFVLLAPAVTASCAADDLLAPGCLTDDERRYLDLTGNADGTYNLGDLVVLRKRTAQINATERRP
jgi:hypothetical protein